MTKNHNKNITLYLQTYLSISLKSTSTKTIINRYPMKSTYKKQKQTLNLNTNNNLKNGN